jgi:hypothetical protein
LKPIGEEPYDPYKVGSATGVGFLAVVPGLNCGRGSGNLTPAAAGADVRNALPVDGC